MTDAAVLPENSIEKPSVIIGKDVLELLSSSMYVNPLVIYREYIQNATDAIDDAVAVGLLPTIEDGRIEISLDHIDRRMVIRDNGTGVSNAEFPKQMLSFGASTKRGKLSRGFRGVGRLAGLGYVQKLIFRSRALGDPYVMEATWDVRTVKRILSSNQCDKEFDSVVIEALNLSKLEATDSPSHFFEVELKKPRRINNDKLLNEVEIESYISQVCPCPMRPSFKHKTEIEDILLNHGRAAKNYNIHINESADPVFRPYLNEIYYSDTKKSIVEENLQLIKISNLDNNQLLAVGWFVHHGYQGAIPVSAGVRGLRARIGNMQIGNERLLAEIFPEERFCSWAVGEVHILDERVIPNGRRDALEVGIHVDHLFVYLRSVGAEIARKCRLASQKRHRSRAIQRCLDKVNEKLGIIEQGAVSDHFIQVVRNDVDELLKEMQHYLESGLFDQAEHRSRKSEIKRVEKKINSAVAKKTNELACVPSDKREAYQEVFDLIYACSIDQITAKNTIDQILIRLNS